MPNGAKPTQKPKQPFITRGYNLIGLTFLQRLGLLLPGRKLLVCTSTASDNNPGNIRQGTRVMPTFAKEPMEAVAQFEAVEIAEAKARIEAAGKEGQNNG